MPPTHIIIDNNWEEFALWELILFMTLVAIFIVITVLRCWMLKKTLVGNGSCFPLPVFYEQDGTETRVSLCALLLFCFCVGSGHSCTSPNSDGTLHLMEGSNVCFQKHNYVTQPIFYEFSLSYWYDTFSFKSYSWSDKGCLQGFCGTESQCSAFSGKTIFMDGKNTSYYVKNCHLFDSTSSGLFCFYQRSCRIWTKEIYLQERFGVHKLSGFKFHDKNHYPCKASVEKPLPLHVIGQYLVTSGSIAYLCDIASPLRRPLLNQLGDVQSSDLNDVVFDTDWVCNGLSSGSDFSCESPKSFMASPDLCIRLPAEVGDLYLDYTGSRLTGYPGDGWPVTLTCEEPLIFDNNKTCHDVTVSVLGKEGMNDDSVAVKIRGHSEGRLSLNISCLDELAEVECNNEWHTFPLDNNKICMFNNSLVRDDRIKVSLNLESTPNTIRVESRWAIYTVVMVLAMICLGFTVLRVIRKLCL